MCKVDADDAHVERCNVYAKSHEIKQTSHVAVTPRSAMKKLMCLTWRSNRPVKSLVCSSVRRLAIDSLM